MIKMKDSGIPWIGQIPEDWVKCFLKNSFNFEKGKNASLYTSEYLSDNKGEIPVYSGQTENNGIMGFVKDYDYFSTGCLFVTTVGAKAMTIKILKGKFCLSQNCLIMQEKKNININFWFYALQILFDYEKSIMFGIMQPSLRIEDLKKYAIFLPNKEIQQKIVEILDKKCGQIDELVSLEENEIEKLKEYKTSLITKVVTKGLDSNAKMKDSGIPWIGQIPEDWKVKRLKYIADTFLKGNGITKDDIVEGGNTPCVRYGDIYTKYEFKFNECKTRTNKEKIFNLQYFTHGDILFTTTGELVEEIGKSVVYMGNKECLAGGDVVIMKHYQEPAFLGYALGSGYVREQKSFGKLKLKVVHISIQDISNIYIALPSKKEQFIIGKYLDKRCEKIDNLIKIKQEKIKKLKEYKKSLIYQYVTGKKEIL